MQKNDDSLLLFANEDEQIHKYWTFAFALMNSTSKTLDENLVLHDNYLRQELNQQLALQCIERVLQSYTKYNDVFFLLKYCFSRMDKQALSNDEFVTNCIQELKQSMNNYRANTQQFNNLYTLFLTRRGGISMASKRYENAWIYYTLASEVNPNFATVWFNKGLVGGFTDREKESLECYTRALQINPKFATAYLNRGNIYYESRQFDKAIMDYTACINISADDYSALFNRSLCYCNLGLYVCAYTDMSKVIQTKGKPMYKQHYNDMKQDVHSASSCDLSSQDGIQIL
jgi:tetratricopeptide (TPR) repeat protein